MPVWLKSGQGLEDRVLTRLSNSNMTMMTLIYLIWGLMLQSTIIVMERRSVYQTTLFPGQALTKWLTSTQFTYFRL